MSWFEQFRKERTAPLNPLLRLALEVGPLGVFFFANAKFGLYTGTGAFMVATAVALAVNWALERRVPVMPLVSGVFVLIFGGLTLYLQDEIFIKMKPTIVNGLFSGTLLVGLACGKSLLKPLFGAAFDLDDTGWRKLTFRWALFLALLAVLNEIVWRSFTTDQWVNFKVFAIMPLTILFTIIQMPLILKHQKNDRD